MKLMKWFSHLVLVGVFAGLPVAGARAQETTGTVEIIPITTSPSSLDQAMATASDASDARAANAAEAKAEKYEKRAKMFRAMAGGAAYKSGELQRADAGAAKYTAMASHYRAMASEEPVCP